MGDRRSWIAYRDLAVTLSIREMVVRYKRSALGVTWALVEPVMNVAVYSVVFGRFLGAWGDMPSYALYTMMGMLPWIFLSSTLEQGSGTFLEHAPLIRKISFPRELLVVAVVVSRLTTLLAGLVLALVLASIKAAMGVTFRWDQLWLVPVGVVGFSLFTFGATLALSSLQVLLRDVAFIVRFGLRLAFFACPIVYAVVRVPPEWRVFYELNPVVGLLWCFQAFVTPAAGGVEAWSVALGLTASIVMAVFGWWAFRTLSPVVADRV